MTLSISTSNVLEDVTPTITDAGIGEAASNISDPNHSLNYTCGSSSAHFAVSYGAQSNISYVGISGHNAATTANATVYLYNGGVLIDSVTLKRNNNIMFTFPLMSFSDLKVVFVTSPVTYQMTLSFMAAGKHLSIDTGVQAGYKRAWLKRHTTQKTTTNNQVGPVTGTVKSVALKGSLKLPHATTDFATGEWQDFIDFAHDQPFFMKEIEDTPESSYMCFDPKEDVAAHGQSPELQVITLKFKVYNGL